MGRARKENRTHEADVRGREPKALMLGEGTRLTLDEDGPSGRPDWTLRDDGAGERELSVTDAMRVAGDRHADYVRIRTRSEAAWLRLVSEWCEQEAERLDRELASAR